MALISTVYPPEIWAMESLLVLSNELVLANLVHRDFENDVKSAGDVINTRKPTDLVAGSLTAHADTNASANVRVQNPNAVNLQVDLSTHSYVAFMISDRDQAASLHDFRKEFLRPAIVPIATAADSAIVTQLMTGTDYASTSITAVAGATVGENAAMDEDDVLAGMKAMNDNKAPLDSRKLVLSSDHHADLLSTTIFGQANESGSTQGLREAFVGRAFGFDTYMSQQITAATDTATSPRSVGFHPNCVSFCQRPLGTLAPGAGALSYEAIHAGMSIRVVESYESLYSGTVVKLEILYGCKLLDAALGTIINP